MAWKSKIKSKVSQKLFENDPKKERKKNSSSSTLRNSPSLNSLGEEQDNTESRKSTSKAFSSSQIDTNQISSLPQSRESYVFKKVSNPLDLNETNKPSHPVMRTSNRLSSNDISSPFSPIYYNPPPSIEIPTIQEILEDSPVAHEKLRKFEVHMEEMADSVRRIVKLSKQVQQIGSSFQQISSQFAEEIKSFQFFEGANYYADEAAGNNNNNNNNNKFQTFVESISRSFVEVTEFQGTLLKQMTTIFTTPMEQFVKKDFRELKEISKNHKIIKIRYDNAISKNSHIKKNETEKVHEIESELSFFRKEFQQSSLSYLSKMKELKATTPLEFLERAAAFLYAEKAYFQHGYNLHNDIEPKLSDFYKQTSSTRDTITNQINEFKSKIGEISEGLLPTAENFKTKEGSRTTTACEIKGYLFTKKSSKWSRKFFSVKEGRLFFHHIDKETKTIVEKELVNLLLCTVRPARDVERRFCFEIVNPFLTLILQAEGEENLQNWMQIIQNAIANQLNNQTTKKNNNNNNIDSESSKLLFQLHQQYPENNLCIDCGAIEPEWVSINLGVLVCIECSGIHRQVGTHISKVRSLTLDALDRETQKLMFSIGNKIAKSIFEYNVPPSVSIPTIDSDRGTRESWIRDKYISKLYLKPFIPPSPDVPNALEIELHKAIKSGSILNIYEKICQGAQVNWADINNNKLSAFHLAVIENQAVTCELLIQNGGDCNIRDANDWTPLHHCAFLNRVECAVLLIKRSAKLDLLDKFQKRALDIAIEHQNAHSVTLLRLASYAEQEHPGNAIEDESFAAALKAFTEEVSETSVSILHIGDDDDNDIDIEG